MFGDEDTDFTFATGSSTSTPDDVLFISVERARYKERIFPGSLFLTLKSGSNNLHLTDNSLTASTDTFVDGGRVYSIYSASAAGAVASTDIEYGKLFPDVGVIALNGQFLSGSTHLGTKWVHVTGSGLHNYTGATRNNLQFFKSIEAGQNFKLRSQETVSSNYVFIRARNSEFNYSNNPSNITGSGELRHSVMIDTPQSYITAVGLYNDNNDLLAVAKLSTPLLKDFTKEALIRVKLDY